MRISLNQIKHFQDQYKWSNDVLAIGVDKLVEKIGAQLGEVESVIDLSQKYAGALIVKIVKSEPHPSADKLKLCLIDDNRVTKDIGRNEEGLIQIVCGANNVRAGMNAVWLPPGSVVPDSLDKEPLVLEAIEIRGVLSNGMLASAKELSLGDNHEGILEVDEDKTPGTSFAITYGLNDTIIEIENKMFTHRPDCFGLIGIAREVAGIQQLAFKSPDWYRIDPPSPKPDENSLSLKITNEISELVPRFTAACLSNVKVELSPLWLQINLSQMGLKPINNVVDLTNYYMMLTGQPLHAYDYDKVKALGSSNEAANIVIRNPHHDEKIKLLNGKVIEPRVESILIATDKQSIGLGGIMGGSETEVDNQTQNVILECANFDMYSIRRTAMAHGLFTDAVTRFTKGQSPLQNLAVLNQAVEDIKQIALGKLASEISDLNYVSPAVMERGSLHPPIKVSADFINSRLGLSLSLDEIKKLLENVEFKATVSDNELIFTAPFWRTDIELREDIVEEVGRLYGYDKLPLKLPMRDLAPAKKDDLLEAKTKIRAKLSASGANEVLTYSFVHEDLLSSALQDKTKAYEVANALRPELQYYRLSLMPSLLSKIYPNIKAGHDHFALYEIGKVHSLDQVEDGLPSELESTALVVTAADKTKPNGSAYYLAKKYLDCLSRRQLEYKMVGDDLKSSALVSVYDLNRAATVFVKENQQFLGVIGEFKPSVLRRLKLPSYSAGFEINTTVISDIFKKPPAYVALPRFPQVVQDLSLKVPIKTDYQTVYDIIWEAIYQSRPERTTVKLSPLDIYQRDEDQDHKNITLRLNIASYDRTLTDSQVNDLLEAATRVAQEKIGAERL